VQKLRILGGGRVGAWWWPQNAAVQSVHPRARSLG